MTNSDLLGLIANFNFEKNWGGGVSTSDDVAEQTKSADYRHIMIVSLHFHQFTLILVFFLYL